MLIVDDTVADVEVIAVVSGFENDICENPRKLIKSNANMSNFVFIIDIF